MSVELPQKAKAYRMAVKDGYVEPKETSLGAYVLSQDYDALRAAAEELQHLNALQADNVRKERQRAEQAESALKAALSDGETITERYMQFASLHDDKEDYLIAKDYNARFTRAQALREKARSC